jgi:RNA polymerase sigma-70 factor (ECF subfamily)
MGKSDRLTSRKRSPVVERVCSGGDALSSVESETVPAPGVPAADDIGTLVAGHWTAVFRLLLSLTGTAHDAEDLTQETFLRALQRRDSFKPGTNLRAWLLRIATNAFLDARRKRKRARTGPLEHDPRCPAPPPGQRLETAERGGLVRSALAGLSDLTRLVFHLRAEEDLSFREIAELAGTSEEAARWHMRQARLHLLKQLGEDF